MFAFGCWAGIKMFLHEKGACQNDVKTVCLQFYGFASWTGTERFVLLNKPVPECLRLVHGKELPVSKGWNSRLPTWEPQVTIARNCRFPELGTPGSQPGNHGLPLQATAGYQRLELMLPNLGTTGCHCKELPFPKGWNWWFPTWEPKVAMARNCRFPNLETYGSQPGNQRLPLQGIAGSQKLEFMFSKLSNYHCKELPVAKAWNSWFQTWTAYVTSGRICWFQKVRTHGS